MRELVTVAVRVVVLVRPPAPPPPRVAVPNGVLVRVPHPPPRPLPRQPGRLTVEDAVVTHFEA